MMEFMVGRSVVDQIEILTLIKQQLSATLRLRAVLQRGENMKRESSSQVQTPNNLRAALSENCSKAIAPFDTTDLKLDAVCEKLKELEEKKQNMIELSKKCANLIDAANKVREYVAAETEKCSLKKRDRESAGLETFGDYAAGAVQACKKIKETK